MLEFAGTEILLCSDIEKFAQRELLRLYLDLKADIVVVPHHGSENTLEPDFLESLDAEIMICNTNTIPKTQDQKSMEKWFYTSRNGAVTIFIDKKGEIRIRTTR